MHINSVTNYNLIMNHNKGAGKPELCGLSGNNPLPPPQEDLKSGKNADFVALTRQKPVCYTTQNSIKGTMPSFEGYRYPENLPKNMTKYIAEEIGKYLTPESIEHSENILSALGEFKAAEDMLLSAKGMDLTSSAVREKVLGKFEEKFRQIAGEKYDEFVEGLGDRAKDVEVIVDPRAQLIPPNEFSYTSSFRLPMFPNQGDDNKFSITFFRKPISVPDRVGSVNKKTHYIIPASEKDLQEIEGQVASKIMQYLYPRVKKAYLKPDEAKIILNEGLEKFISGNP